MKRLFIICAFLLAFSLNGEAQESTFTLSGTVLTNESEPVIGATVYFKDRPGGTTTSTDGRFRIQARLYDVLVVSYLGYETYEQTITTNQSDIIVIMSPSASELEEVVVVGMGTQRKASVVGAITTVNVRDLEVPSTNIVNTLGGRVPGIISMQSSGEPGKNISEFWVRGIGTFGANSGALVLIDGLEGDLSQIEPADVESFSVLKDASATAVYGSRGANGVVLVTTKRGTDQKLSITYRSSYTVSQLTKLPKYLRAAEYAELANEASVESGNDPLYTPIQLDIIKYGLDTDLYPDVDWQKEILNKTSFQHTQYVSARGGGSVARYFVSLGMSQESSAYNSQKDSKYSKGVGYDTYNYRINTDMNLTKTTQLFVGVTGHMSVSKRPSLGEPYGRGRSFTDWIWQSQAKTTPLMYPLRYSSGELPASGTQSDIPPHVLLNYTGNAKEEEYRNLVNIGLQQDLSFITEGLTAKINGSWDNKSVFGESRYLMPELYYASERTNNGLLKLVQRVSGTSIDYNSGAWTWKKLYADANVTYDRAFGDHRVGGLLFYYLESTSEAHKSSSMEAIPQRYQSLSGRATYGFRNTYFIDVNFGLNGSENFRKGKQYGFFPSGAIGWVPTSYEWMKDNMSWLNFFKIRASYGIVGNDRISSIRFPYLTIIDEGYGSTWWGGQGTLTENRVGADNLMWEKAKKFDVGLDVEMFNDRFSFTVDYFTDRREGIFQQRTQIPDYVGVISMPYGNVGDMKSWGGDGNFEFYQPVNKELYFVLRGNFTLSKNKILNWEEAEQKYNYLTNNGFANNVQRGYIATGLFRDQHDVDMSPTQFGNVRPGDIKYKDVNGDGVINEEDMVPISSNSYVYGFGVGFYVPQLMYGFGAELSYKNWRLNVMFKGTGNNTFLYGDRDAGRFDGYIPFNNGYQGNVMAFAYDQKNRWTSAEYSGDRSTENPHAMLPRLYYGKNENNTKPSTFWMGNARYLRLQELSINYNLKSAALTRAVGIQSIDFQIMAENLFVFSGVKYFDPEQAWFTGQVYPIPRRFSLQLYFNF